MAVKYENCKSEFSKCGINVLYISNIILTYRNNPSYISMVILSFLSVHSNTDQILMK